MDEHERPQIGDVRMSYLIQPVGLNGREINGGMSYSNANTREDAEKMARRWMSEGGRLGSLSKVTVYGREMVLSYDAWQPIKEGRTEYFEVTREDAEVEPVFLDPSETRCWDTTVMDYFETVHAMRTDGSCQCGDPTRNTRR